MYDVRIKYNLCFHNIFAGGIKNMGSKAVNKIDNIRTKNSIKKSAEATIIKYLSKKGKNRELKDLEKAYYEMAKINLEISELGFYNDMDDFARYEKDLASKDPLDTNNK